MGTSLDQRHARGTPHPPPSAPPRNLAHRRHELSTGGRATRLLIRAQDVIERVVARVSVHPDRPVYDPRLFPWVADVEREWRAIRAELDAILPQRAQLPSFHEILTPVAAITRDDDWKTFWLAGIGMDCRENQARCPDTTRILHSIPGMKTAFFSILAPGKHIPAHRGAYNGILRFHLGLLVPEPRALCRIRVGNDVLNWEEGKGIVFDDTFNHEVWNETGGVRVVLFVDFARPLRRPWHRLNDLLLSVGVFAPFLREADARQKNWAKAFYRS